MVKASWNLGDLVQFWKTSGRAGERFAAVLRSYGVVWNEKFSRPHMLVAVAALMQRASKRRQEAGEDPEGMPKDLAPIIAKVKSKSKARGMKEAALMKKLRQDLEEQEAELEEQAAARGQLPGQVPGGKPKAEEEEEGEEEQLAQEEGREDEQEQEDDAVLPPLQVRGPATRVLGPTREAILVPARDGVEDSSGPVRGAAAAVGQEVVPPGGWKTWERRPEVHPWDCGKVQFRRQLEVFAQDQQLR